MSVESTANGSRLRRTTSFANSQALTIVCFLRLNSVAGGNFFTGWDHGGSTFVPQFYFDGSGDPDYGGLTLAINGTGTASDKLINVTHSPTAGAWYGHATVLNGTGNVANAYWNVDGGAISSGATTANFAGFGGANFNLFDENADDQTLNGQLCGVRVWTAALTRAEIEWELRRISPRRLANLYAFLPLLNGTSPEKDKSGAANDFTAAGTLTTNGSMPPVPWGPSSPRFISIAAASLGAMPIETPPQAARRSRVSAQPFIDFPIKALPIGTIVHTEPSRWIPPRVARQPLNEKPLAALVPLTVVPDAPPVAMPPRRVVVQPAAERPIAASAAAAVVIPDASPSAQPVRRGVPQPALDRPLAAMTSMAVVVPEAPRLDPLRRRPVAQPVVPEPTVSLAPTSSWIDDGGGMMFVKSPAVLVFDDEPPILALPLGRVPDEPPLPRPARSLRLVPRVDDVPPPPAVARIIDEPPLARQRSVTRAQPPQEPSLVALPIGAFPLLVELGVLPRRIARQPMAELPLAAVSGQSLGSWFDPGPAPPIQRQRVVVLQQNEVPLAALPIGSLPAFEAPALPVRTRVVRQPLSETLPSLLLPWIDDGATLARPRARVVLPSLPEALGSLVIPLGALIEDLPPFVRRRAPIRTLEPDFVPTGLFRPWIDDAPLSPRPRRRRALVPLDEKPLAAFVPVTLLPWFDDGALPQRPRARPIALVQIDPVFGAIFLPPIVSAFPIVLGEMLVVPLHIVGDLEVAGTATGEAEVIEIVIDGQLFVVTI